MDIFTLGYYNLYPEIKDQRNEVKTRMEQKEVKKAQNWHNKDEITIDEEAQLLLIRILRVITYKKGNPVKQEYHKHTMKVIGIDNKDCPFYGYLAHH